ncbi:hypothetical protein [Oleisolibacter albus]|uniref:hypothetical protein n=1 Tax=Oleisolibacter albus TaxID=2171757 RepID=UPI000DF2191B|nr:hypothetical protein [Oleisolibacter albus]
MSMSVRTAARPVPGTAAPQKAALAGLLLSVLCLSAAPALAQQPAAKADIPKAVACQTLVAQFNDAIGPSKAADDAKKAARDLLAAGNKACNEKNYDAGIEQVRQALTTIAVKPVA